MSRKVKNMRVLSEQPNKKSYQDGNLRLKVFGASFKKSDILNEALNQARVEETGLQIPKLLEVKQIDGQWTIVTEFIEGETLEQAVDYAKSIYGTDDIIWYNNQGGRRPHAVASFPVLSGDQDARLRAVQAAADSTQQAA